jgi:epoxyqueuosine reductase
MPVQVPNSQPKTDPQRVLDLAHGLGFALAGIAPARPSGYADFVRQWIADGRHGEMAYLENHLGTRLDPGRLLEGARSVICLADLHPSQTDLPPHGPTPHGRIARYAFGDDYHKTVKKRLHRLADTLAAEHPGERFRSTVDTAPILEREHAARAGLGWIGKHTLLIHPYLGSYMLLGTVVTTLNLETAEDAGPPGSADPGIPVHGTAGSPALGSPGSPGSPGVPGPVVPPADHCGTCTRCIDACPTGCISTAGPRFVDATRCISYLTLEHRSAIDPALHGLMGDWIAGCDVCQEVCPYNRDRGAGFGDRGDGGGGEGAGNGGRANAAGVPTGAEPRVRLGVPAIHPAHTPRPPAPGLSLLDILGWSEEDRRAVFKGSALKRIKLGMFKRNALIAAGNALAQEDVPGLRQRVGRIAEDPSEPKLVRVTARRVLERLGHGTDRVGP